MKITRTMYFTVISTVLLTESMRTPKNDHTTKTPKTDNTNSTRDVDCWNDELPHLYVPSVSSQSRNLSQRRTRCERPSLDTFLEIQNSLAGQYSSTAKGMAFVL